MPKYMSKTKPFEGMTTYDPKAQAATGTGGRTKPNVTLTPYDDKLKKGKTVEVGGAKSKKIRKPNRPMGY